MKNKNEEIVSRRAFFKKAAGVVLPIIAAAVMPSLTSCEIDEPYPGDIDISDITGGCKNGCSSACKESCSNQCTRTCATLCQGQSINTTGCRMGSCKGHCFGSCRGTCSNSAS